MKRADRRPCKARTTTPYIEKISSQFPSRENATRAFNSPLHGENGNLRKPIKTHKIKALLRLPRYTG
jgi:hypothetical protein